MPKPSRKVAKRIASEFRKQAPTETMSSSAVEGSLDRMAGASQKAVPDKKPVRRKIDARAKQLSRTK